MIEFEALVSVYDANGVQDGGGVVDGVCHPHSLTKAIGEAVAESGIMPKGGNWKLEYCKTRRKNATER